MNFVVIDFNVFWSVVTLLVWIGIIGADIYLYKKNKETLEATRKLKEETADLNKTFKIYVDLYKAHKKP